MGAVHIDNQNIFDSIEYFLEKSEVDDFSKKMTEMQQVLKVAEEIRYCYSNLFGQMLYETGAIVLKEPNLRNSLKGLLYQIARDYDIEPQIFLVKNSSPYLEFNQNIEINSEIKRTYSSIVSFLDGCNNLITRIDACYTNCKNILRIYNDEYRKWEEDHFTFYNKDKVKIRYFHQISERNIYKIKYSIDVLEFLKKKLSVISSEGNDFYQVYQNENLKAKQKERMIRIRNSYIQSENKQSFLDNRMLYYLYTTSDRYKDPDDWKKLYFGKIRTNKVYTIPENANNIVAELKKRNLEEKMDKLSQEEILNMKIQDLTNKNIELEKKHFYYKSQSEFKNVIFIHKILPLKSPNLVLNYSIKIGENTYPKSIAIDNDNKYLIAGMKNGDVIIFSYYSKKIEFNSNNHKDTVSSVCYMNNGMSCLSGGKDGILAKFYLNKENDTVNKVLISSQDKISSIVNVLDGEVFYLSCGRKVFCMDFNLCSEIKENSLIFEEDILKIVFLREENYLLIAFKSGLIKIISLTNKVLIHEFKIVSSIINDFCMCKVDNIYLIAICTIENNILLYNITQNTVEKQHNFDGVEIIKRILYCHDNKNFICCFNKGKVLIWNFKDDKIKEIVKEGKGRITCCGYLGDSVNVFFADVNGNLDFYHIKH